MATRSDPKPNTVWDQWQESKDLIDMLESQLKTERVRERQLAHKIFSAINEVGGMVLSRRQAQVMELLRSHPGGMSNKELANTLNIAERTVKFHISSLLGIYGVQNRQQLAVRAALPHQDGQ